MNSKPITEIENTEIHLYDDPSTENLNLDDLASYIKEKFSNSKVLKRNSLMEIYDGPVEKLAESIAGCKVRNSERQKTDFEPLPGEINFEEGLVKNPSKDISGVLYDGILLAEIFRYLITKNQSETQKIHIVFTNRLFGTWDENDKRYHARVSVYSIPNLISTTGIVEGPAKPKQFYREKRKLARMNMASGEKIEKLKEKFKGKFIDYKDKRLTEVMKGYVMQAIFHHLFLEPFCEKKHCRLYNAHWQEEVIKAQLEPPEFCNEHKRILEEF